MRIAWFFSIGLAEFSMLAQVADEFEICKEVNETVLTNMAAGRLDEAETALSSAPNPTCTGVVLSNMAFFMQTNHALKEAEIFARRAIAVFAENYAPSHRVFLHPQRVLAVIHLDQGQIRSAREVVQQMLRIPAERPGDQVTVHSTLAAVLHAEGRLKESESEYLASLHAIQESGRDSSADAGALLQGLSAVYIKEQRLVDAHQALDRAVVILANAKDAVTSDHIRTLWLKGMLDARQGQWLHAEENFRRAIAMVEGPPGSRSYLLRSLLPAYAAALKKNHKRREARRIEAQAAVLAKGIGTSAVVDVTELVPKNITPEK